MAPADGLLRPTSARRREAVLDIVRARLGTLDGARVADLFAGTGAVGLEALSQGAEHVLFVENDPAAADLLKRNIEALDARSLTTLLRNDATRLGAAARPVDVAFLDPPYGRGLTERALTRLMTGGWLTSDSIVLVELGRNEPFAAPPGLTLAREHHHGAGRLLRLSADD